jgi:cytochrome c5
MHRSRLPRFRAAAVLPTILAIVALVAGCRGAERSVVAARPATAPVAFAEDAPVQDASAGNTSTQDTSAHDASAHAQRVARLWAQHCALCHVNGEGGAPRLGNAAEWQPRVAQDKSVLLRHTLEGFNNMPPLGYCMSCEHEDFAALIQFMAGDS